MTSLYLRLVHKLSFSVYLICWVPVFIKNALWSILLVMLFGHRLEVRWIDCYSENIKGGNGYSMGMVHQYYTYIYIVDK
jgi:hypothetical protein